jgi:hypothetical protein
MTTTMTTVENVVSYPALRPDSRQARIIEANLDGEPMREMDLVRVKTPLGGATKWSVEVDGNSESCDELVGLLVGIGKRGYLWPSEDPSESRPVLESRDLLIARRLSDDLGSLDPKALEKYRVGDRTYDWAAISTSPEFGFGSSKGGQAGEGAAAAGPAPRGRHLAGARLGRAGLAASLGSVPEAAAGLPL